MLRMLRKSLNKKGNDQVCPAICQPAQNEIDKGEYGHDFKSSAFSPVTNSQMEQSHREHDSGIMLLHNNLYANSDAMANRRLNNDIFNYSNSTGDDTVANFPSEFAFSGDKFSQGSLGTKSVSTPPIGELDIQKYVEYLANEHQYIGKNAAAYLCHLTFNNPEVKEKVAESEGIQNLSTLALSKDEELQLYGIKVLRNLSHGASPLIRLKFDRAFVVSNLISVVSQYTAGAPDGSPLSVRIAKNMTLESISATLCNLSAYDEFKEEIVKHGIPSLVRTVLLPLCGMQEFDESGRDSFSSVDENVGYFEFPVFIFSTGTIRNVLTESVECRQLLRETRGLVLMLIHTVKTCVYRSDYNCKGLENCVCILRNLSFALQEVRDPAYLVRREAQFYTALSNSIPDKRIHLTNRKIKKRPVGYVKKDAVDIEWAELGSQLATPPSNLVTVRGGHHLWDLALLPTYISVLQCSDLPVIQEAVAGAIQNLTACDWQPSAAIRKRFREDNGLPVLLELLRSENDHVTKTTATALRNLSVDEKNRQSIAVYGMALLVSRLPVLQNQLRPEVSRLSVTKTLSSPGRKATRAVSLGTASCILSAIFTLIKNDPKNGQLFIDCGGVPPCLAIAHSGFYEDPTATIPTDRDKTVCFARSLLQMLWNMKELQAVFKLSEWSAADFCVNDPLNELSIIVKSCMPIPKKRHRMMKDEVFNPEHEEPHENEREIGYPEDQTPRKLNSTTFQPTIPAIDALSDRPIHTSFSGQRSLSFVDIPINLPAYPPKTNFHEPSDLLKLPHEVVNREVVSSLRVRNIEPLVYPRSPVPKGYRLRQPSHAQHDRLMVPYMQDRLRGSQEDLASVALSAYVGKSRIYKPNVSSIRSQLHENV